MTARWVVDEVQPERNFDVTWEPISLLLKNRPDPQDSRYPTYERTHNLLRVMESVRAADGNVGVFSLYWEFGRRIHHDQNLMDFPLGDALSAVGLDKSHINAYEEEDWDEEIQTRMGTGLALAGDDIGTPIIAFDNAAGRKIGIFGPVITRVPNREHSLQLWDGLQMVMSIPGFWELKRTRTERPEFGERP